MTFVLDASVALALVLPDEHSAGAQRVMAATAGRKAWVPTLWEYEVMSGLRNAETRARITPDDADRALGLLQLLPVRAERPIGAAVMEIARETSLSVYDASYLAIAVAHDVAMATWDQRLSAGARSIGIDVVEV